VFPLTAEEFMVPVTADGAFEPKGVMVVPLSVPVTADVEFVPSGVIVVPFNVPVTAEVPFVPVGVTVWVWVAKADPAKVGCVNVPAAIVGTPAGHEIVG
jgi:hypothetical protein